LRLSEREARSRFAAARVARLGTVDANGRPHLVVFTFALVGDTIVHAVDHKPKGTTDLRRIRNIRENPAVTVLADHYEDDAWERLWWVRADGHARVIEDDDGRAEPIRHLVARYRQYRERVPTGPVIEVAVSRWTGWSYT
jgi:PPOX class probable F420-dependent enzyme